MMNSLNQIGILVGKDLRIEARGRQTIGLILVLGILIIVVLGFGFEQRLVGFKATKILWAAYLFAGVLCFEKTMAVERNDDALAGLLVSPIDRGVIYISKLLTNIILMFSLAVVITPVGLVLFRFNLSEHPYGFALTMALGMLGYAAIGTLFSAAISSTSLQGGLLAMLVFPLTLPVVIASTLIMKQLFREGGELNLNGIAMLAAFDILAIVGSWIVFELVIEP